MEGVDAVVHFAAESHVDRSIEGPAVFVKTNVVGTQVLLDAALKAKPKIFVQVSTDEVYGSLGESGLFTEDTPLAPNSPYSASKAAADLLALAYRHTYGLPVVVTRCSNNYGPYQFPEKLIPLFINNAMKDIPLPLYGDGLNVRDWLHVSDHCKAVGLVMRQGREGEVYNIGGNNEKKNIEITKIILESLGKPESLISYVEDRLGHDRRYAIDSSKIQSELGWKPGYGFIEGIIDTINWYRGHQDWCAAVSRKTGK
jgi:dTDP-glucose 4,6-dehydratase